MKGQYLSLIALLFTMGQLATAAEIEDSLKGDFLRDKNGFLITGTTQRQASDACARQGKRLPTAREIAFLGIRNGAALIEVNDYKANNIPSGSRITSFYIKKTIEDNGLFDPFYYSVDNYKRKAGDIDYWAWSSSRTVDHLDYFFMFHNSTGNIAENYQYEINVPIAIKCVPRSGR